MDKQFYIYLAIMSLITYAIRAIPLVFINKKIYEPNHSILFGLYSLYGPCSDDLPRYFLFNRSFDFWNRCDNHYYLCIL